MIDNCDGFDSMIKRNTGRIVVRDDSTMMEVIKKYRMAQMPFEMEFSVCVSKVQNIGSDEFEITGVFENLVFPERIKWQEELLS
jgi:hypothetical protein